MNSVLACGSREWADYPFILDCMTELRIILGDFQLIHGGARGADTFSGIIAHRMGLPEPIVDVPEWDRCSKAAGFKRNTRMLERRPDYVVAFYFGAGGTADTISKAVNQFRIPTLVYRKEPNGRESN